MRFGLDGAILISVLQNKRRLIGEDSQFFNKYYYTSHIITYICIVRRRKKEGLLGCCVV
jgi:hypothetical protein